MTDWLEKECLKLVDGIDPVRLFFVGAGQWVLSVFCTVDILPGEPRSL
jgi:hypothetical protein